MDDPSYLKLLPLFPDYAFGDEQIDGLVPACRVESWEKFIEAMRTPGHNMAKGEIVYRGQAGHHWYLSSTLSRLFGGGTVPSGHEASLLHEFRLAMRGRGLDLSNIADDREVWALGQHHGLCTPLIDWTKSPYVALFFAFDEMDVEGLENPTRAVFCLNMTAIREILPGMIFEPTHHENARLVNQAGLFTITPSGGDNLVSAILNALAESDLIDPSKPMDVAHFVSKIHIPNQHRVDCLNTLRKMNIHHANLFPDPGGASKYCNDWLARVVEEERVGEVKAKALEQRQLQEQIEEQEQQQEVAPAKPDPHLISDGVISPDVVTDMLESMLTDRDDYPSDLMAGWAQKIISLYERAAGTDWPERETARAGLKLELRKFFMSNSVNKSVADASALQLLDLFEANWRKVNNRPRPEQKRGGFFKFPDASGDAS